MAFRIILVSKVTTDNSSNQNLVDSFERSPLIAKTINVEYT